MRYLSKLDDDKRQAALHMLLAESEARAAAATPIPRPVASKTFPSVTKLLRTEQKRILITGGAGFVGSHLTDALMRQGHLVYVLDNLFTGRRENIEHWIGEIQFQSQLLPLTPSMGEQVQSATGPKNRLAPPSTATAQRCTFLPFSCLIVA